MKHEVKKESRCPAHCSCHDSSRRDFLKKAAFLGVGIPMMGRMAFGMNGESIKIPLIQPYGTASSYIPQVKAAFVRRKEDYGLWWPGDIYDGETALKQYTRQLTDNAKSLGIKLDLKKSPIFSIQEADNWIDEAKKESVDGLVLILLDRQQHSWPTAVRASKSGIPLIVFSPLGTSFTSNTGQFVGKPGVVVYATNDFNQAVFGMKMLKAKARMNHTRGVIIRGNKREERKLADTGITLQYIPARAFMDLYNNTPDSKEIVAMANEYLKRAEKISLATKKDVINGIKSYVVAGILLKEERADAISMDCLGALEKEKISLPCISWSRMNDDRIPAACEADTGALASQIIVQYLFDRPGFQQDPVGDTSDDTFIGAHCSCPTRLDGFDKPSSPFELTHHHGNRDAVPRTIWKTGQRVTCIDFFPSGGEKSGSGDQEKIRSKMLIASGNVVENMDVPPSGGCVVSVKFKMDGGHDVLSFPGFHQVFFYGDYKNEMEDFCQLCNFETQII